MKILYASTWVSAYSRQSATPLRSIAFPLLSSSAVATDSCGSGGCTPGCGDQMLTGPTQGSIYQPSQPPLEDNCTDFIQQPTPPDENPSSTPPSQDYSAPFNQPQASSSSLFSGGVEGTLTAQGASQAHTPGYINWAVPRSQFRLRFDAGFNNITPDRAEYFYAQCGCNPGAPGPGSPGTPPSVNGSVDYQDLRGYIEIANGNRFSVFGEVPVRFLQGTGATNLDPGILGTGDNAGISDLEAGFKYALIRDADSIFTFQLKGYFPTGNARQGLGPIMSVLSPAFWHNGELTPDWMSLANSLTGFQSMAARSTEKAMRATCCVMELVRPIRLPTRTT